MKVAMSFCGESTPTKLNADTKILISDPIAKRSTATPRGVVQTQVQLVAGETRQIGFHKALHA